MHKEDGTEAADVLYGVDGISGAVIGAFLAHCPTCAAVSQMRRGKQTWPAMAIHTDKLHRRWQVWQGWLVSFGSQT